MPGIRWYAAGLVVAFCIFFILGGFDLWHTLQSAATKAAVVVAAILSIAKVAQEALPMEPDDEYHTMGRDMERSLWERVW